MFKNIDHLNIVVSSLEETARFFCNFGFKEVASGELEGKWTDEVVALDHVRAEYVALELPGCPTKIELIHYSSPRSAVDSRDALANQIGFRHIAFEVDDIESVVEELKKKKAQLFSNIKVYPTNGKKLLYFYGPDNIILELAEYVD